jgi:hypothetical protein
MLCLPVGLFSWVLMAKPAQACDTLTDVEDVGRCKTYFALAGRWELNLKLIRNTCRLRFGGKIKEKIRIRTLDTWMTDTINEVTVTGARTFALVSADQFEFDEPYTTALYGYIEQPYLGVVMEREDRATLKFTNRGLSRMRGSMVSTVSFGTAQACYAKYSATLSR